MSTDDTYTEQLRELLYTQALFYPEPSPETTKAAALSKARGERALPEPSSRAGAVPPPLPPKEPRSSTQTSARAKHLDIGPPLNLVSAPTQVERARNQAGVQAEKKVVTPSSSDPVASVPVTAPRRLRSKKRAKNVVQPSMKDVGENGQRPEVDKWTIVLWGELGSGKTSFAVRVCNFS